MRLSTGVVIVSRANDTLSVLSEIMTSLGGGGGWHSGRNAVRIFLAAGVAGSLAIFFKHVVRLWPETVDDAFISFRYSKMLAEGHGPTFNPSGPHAEGYTSFLWMLVMAFPHVAGMSPVVFAKVLSIVLMIGAMGAAALITDRVAAVVGGRACGLMALVPVALLSYFLSTAVHAVAGMETALYTFTVTVFFALLVLYQLRPERHMSRLLAVFALLVGLTRPDGNLIVLAGATSLFVLIDRTSRRNLIFDLATIYVLPGLAYFLWRLSYYGHLFPLSYYVKLGHVGGLAGTGYLSSFLTLFHWLLPVAIVGLIGKGWKLVLPPAIASIALLCFFVFPAPITGFDWRFLFPVVPFIFALVGIAVARVVAIWNSPTEVRRKSRVAILAAVLALFGVATIHDLDLGTAGEIAAHRFNARINHRREAFGRFLARFQPPAARHLLTVSDAGAIPYYSGWRAIDTFSLNDAHIAVSGDRDPHYVLSHDPDAIFIISGSAKTLTDSPRSPPGALASAASAEGMQHVTTLMVIPNAYYFLGFARPGTAVANYLMRWRN